MHACKDVWSSLPLRDAALVWMDVFFLAGARFEKWRTPCKVFECLKVNLLYAGSSLWQGLAAGFVVNLIGVAPVS